MSLSSQKKAESERLIISNLESSFMANTWLDSFMRTYVQTTNPITTIGETVPGMRDLIKVNVLCKNIYAH